MSFYPIYTTQESCNVHKQIKLYTLIFSFLQRNNEEEEEEEEMCLFNIVCRYTNSAM